MTDIPPVGETLESFLKEEGIYEEVEAAAQNQVNEWRNIMGDAINMPLYQSHKRVHALKIAAVVAMSRDKRDDSTRFYRVSFVDKNFAAKDFDQIMFLRFTPSYGDYYVIYDDGYESFSPCKAFEDGYSLV